MKECLKNTKSLFYNYRKEIVIIFILIVSVGSYAFQSDRQMDETSGLNNKISMGQRMITVGWAIMTTA